MLYFPGLFRRTVLASALLLPLAGAVTLGAGRPQATPASVVELPRRPFLGIMLAPLPEAERARGVKGVLVRGASPGSTAQDASLQAGDILLKVNGTPVANPPEAIAAARKTAVGSPVSLEILRDGKPLTRSAAVKPFPYETSPDFDIQYTAVEAAGARRRVIVTRPRSSTGRHPAVLLIGGIGCYSFDHPLDDNDAYKKILYAFTRAGYATVRVEKSGVGDSEGAPCSGVDFNNEVAGYRSALKMLKGLPFVDPDNVFLVGHSMGGIIGPRLASETPVRGLAAIATSGVPWYEYELVNTRRQLVLAGEDDAEIERLLRLKARAAYRLLIEKKTPDEILKETPEAEPFVRAYPAHYTYIQQVADQPLAELWQKANAQRVLLIYGAADFVTGREDHLYLTDVVNRAHPGRATYVEIKDMDHFIDRVASQKESLALRQQPPPAPGKAPADLYNPRLAEELLRWMEQSRKKA